MQLLRHDVGADVFRCVAAATKFHAEHFFENADHDALVFFPDRAKERPDTLP
jgi:hypothetical protein